jgi:hypothetical protein
MATTTTQEQAMNIIESYKTGYIKQSSDRHGVFYIARRDGGTTCVTDRISAARRFLGQKEMAA